MAMMGRRAFLAGAGAWVAAIPAARAAAPAAAGGHVRSILVAELASGRPCASQAAAIKGTLARMADTRPPTEGRSIVVDLPSQTLTAYEGGDAVLDSIVVVGDPGWRTPDLDTTVAYVRFNPTWTVPESIVEARDWQSKLRRSPGYFSKLDFKVVVDGRAVSPEQAAASGGRATRFVQQAGAGNALGRVKFGLNAGQSIYLHDTNDKAGFGEEGRALSHGCMRVERAMDLAAWALGMDGEEARRHVTDGDAADHAVHPAIRVLTTYFTAWPDKDGVVAYYDDVYGRDGAPRGAGGCTVTSTAGHARDGETAEPGATPPDYVDGE